MPRYNLQIKVGTYTGNGVDLTEITDVGFKPQFVIVKGGANTACFRTKQMAADSCAYLASNTANFSSGIKGFLDTGFQLGTDAKANANGTTYYYVAMRGVDAQQYFRTLVYGGNGSDARQLTSAGIFFQPNIFFTKGNRADNPCVRTESVVGDNSWHFSGSADAANEIQNFVANGVELGTSSRVNSNGSEYFAVALKHFSVCIASGTYTGNAADDREITGVGFQPDVVIIKNGATTNAAVIRTSDFAAGNSASLAAAAPTTDLIQSFISDGFSVGTNVAVNGNTNTIYWIAIKAGNFNVPITRVAV